LDELILAAKKRNNDEAVLELLDRVEQMDNEAFKGAAAQLHELCTGWDSLVSGSEAKANLCLKLAERDILNYVEEKREEKPAKGNKFSRPERIVTFRDVLYTAIRAMTPPYFGGEIVWNAIGAKNSTDSVSVVAARFRKLKSLQTNMLIYFTETKQWLRVDNFDKSKSSMSVRELNGTAYSSISVAGAVSKTIFFQTDAVFCKMLKTNTTKLTGPQYRAKFCKYAVSDYSEKDLTDIVRKIFVPASMTQDEFEAWWNAEQKVEVKERGFFESRSVLEFYTSLQKMNDAGTPITITAESAEKVKHFLVKVSCLGGKVAGELYEYLLHPETAEDGANQKTRGQCFENLSAVGIRGEVTKRLITGMNDFAKCEDKNELTDL